MSDYEQVPGYPFAQGAMAMRLCDVPEGWQWRYSPTDGWFEGPRPTTTRTIVEARPTPKPPVTVTLDRDLAEHIATRDGWATPSGQAVQAAVRAALAAAEGSQ